MVCVPWRYMRGLRASAAASVHNTQRTEVGIRHEVPIRAVHTALNSTERSLDLELESGVTCEEEKVAVVFVAAVAVVEGREVAVAQVVPAVLLLALFRRHAEYDLRTCVWMHNRGRQNEGVHM